MLAGVPPRGRPRRRRRPRARTCGPVWDARREPPRATAVRRGGCRRPFARRAAPPPWRADGNAGAGRGDGAAGTAAVAAAAAEGWGRKEVRAGVPPLGHQAPPSTAHRRCRAGRPTGCTPRPAGRRPRRSPAVPPAPRACERRRARAVHASPPRGSKSNGQGHKKKQERGAARPPPRSSLLHSPSPPLPPQRSLAAASKEITPVPHRRRRRRPRRHTAPTTLPPTRAAATAGTAAQNHRRPCVGGTPRHQPADHHHTLHSYPPDLGASAPTLSLGQAQTRPPPRGPDPHHTPAGRATPQTTAGAPRGAP